MSAICAMSNIEQFLAQLSATMNEMGPNTVAIMISAGSLIAALVVYLVYSSFKGSKVG